MVKFYTMLKKWIMLRGATLRVVFFVLTMSMFTTVSAQQYALDFDGVNDHVSFANPTAFPTGSNTYTLEAWVYPDTMGDKGIAGWGNYGTANGANAFRLLPNGIRHYWWSNDLDATTGSLVGAWHHIAATCSSTERKIYLDGVLVASQPITVSQHTVPAPTNFTIGKTFGGEFFDGKIDNVRIWTVARTQSEIQLGMSQTYGAGTPGLAASYSFNEGSGTTLTDAVNPASNNGTLQNFALSGTTSNWVVNTYMPITRYVKQGGTGNGLSWADASGNLQNTINAANAGDEVWVAAGAYQPAAGQSFAMKNKVKIYGGFATTGTPAFSTRNFSANATILMGNGNRVINNEGQNLTNTAVLDGFTITNGVTTGHGAGIRNVNSYPVIANCIFKNNASDDWGGGLFNQGVGNTIVYNCLFYNNSAGGGGGAFDNNTNTKYVNTTFSANHSLQNGGGVHTHSSSIIIMDNCIVWGNTANAGGSQIFSSGDCFVSFNYSLTNNSAAGVYGPFNTDNCIYTDPIFINAAGYNFRLKLGSPAINKGSTILMHYATVDLDGLQRQYGAAVDMGAYEHQSVAPHASAQIFCGATTVASLAATGTDLKWYTALTGGTALVTTAAVTSGTYYVSQTLNYYESSRTAVSITVKTVPAAPTAAASQSFHDGATIANISVSGNNLQWFSTSTGGTPLETTQPLANGTYYVSQTTDGCESPRTAVTVATYQAIKYVKPVATGSGDGTSWANASSNLQGMIDSPGTEQVWVAAGTYKPTKVVGTGTGDRHKSFQIKINVKIYGGFAGNETVLSQRNWKVNETILSGDLGVQDNDADNVYQVVTSFGNVGTAMLDGFTITKGNATGGPWVFINDVQIFKGYTNTILNYDSSPAYSNLKITGNKGGTYCIYSRGSLSVFDNVTITNNTPTDTAIYCSGLSAILRNVTVTDNTGTGITCSSSIPDFTNVNVSGNARGIYMSSVNACYLKNVLVSGNAGDAVVMNMCNAYDYNFNNVTISGNAGYSILNYSFQSYIMVKNSIIHGNLYNISSQKIVLNSLEQSTGDTNDALFVYQRPYTEAPFSNGDYNLRPCSMMVNWGSNSHVGDLTTDIAGNPRIYGGTVDMGAYELQEAQLPTITWQPSAPYSQQFLAGATVSDLVATGNNLQWYTIRAGGLPLAPNTLLVTGDYFVSQTLNGCEGFRSKVAVTVNYPEIVYVKPVATGNGSGSSWQNASANLQTMINAAGVQQVWVAAGTYKPGVKAGNGSSIQHNAFVMKNNVKVYGGFSGNETLLEQRNITANTSILSGDLGIEGNTTDNAYHVVICSGNVGTATLDGFTISHGNARGHTPSLAHVVNNNQISDREGGGIYCTKSSPLFSNITLTDNIGMDGAAMMIVEASTVTMSKLTIRNSAGASIVTGAVYIYDATLLVNDAVVSGNNNTAFNCYFSIIKLKNTVIAGNFYDGIFNRSSDVDLRNVTISGNGNYGIRNNGGAGWLHNTVVYGNRYGVSESNSMKNSLVQGFDSSENGNFNGSVDPLFVYAPPYTLAPFTSGDYRLQSCSPILNAGNNEYALNITVDLLGLPRVYNNTVDIGAYECQYVPNPVPLAPVAVPQSFGDGATIADFIATGIGLKWYSVPIGGTLLNGSTPALSATYYVSQTVDGCESPRTPVTITVSYLPVRYVRATASGLGNGRNWANASANLQAMIDAPGVEQVWVAGGQYQPQTGQSFTMKNGVKIYGGFPASGNPGMASRNISTHKTILNGNGNSVIVNNGNGLTNTALLDGFTIQGGNGFSGGGIYNVNSYPIINNCIFKNNTASNSGGALYNSGNGNTRVTNCLFHDNKANDGGAVYDISRTIYTNSTFVNNLAAGYGGAFFTTSTAYIQLYNCIVYGNTAFVMATEILVAGQASVSPYNCMIFSGTNAFYYVQLPQNNAVAGIPLFKDAANGDYTLQAISPGIDAGNATYFANASTATDLSGSTRLYGSSIDVGAYEYKPQCGVNTQWNGTAWSNGIPVSYDYTAVITGNYNTSEHGNIKACSLTVTDGEVVVAEGDNFTIKGVVTVDNENASFTINNNASLIQVDAVANVGTVTVIKKSAPLYRQDYTLWSAPVAGQGVRSFSLQTIISRFHNYNPITDNYNDLFTTEASATGINFASAQSYLIRMPNGSSTQGYNAGTATLAFEGKFTGVPNNGTITIPVVPQSLQNSVAGYNAIGNPYPSPVNILSFFAGNVGKTDGIIYFYRKKNGSNAGSAYCTVNSVGDFTSNLQPGVINPNGILQPGQGFIVRSLNTNLAFTNSMRTTGVGSGQLLRNTPTEEPVTQENHRLWLNLAKEGIPVAQMLVAYKPNATTGIDAGIDAPFINDAANALNSVIEGNTYAIQGRPLPLTNQDVVPLQFKAATTGTYSIFIAETTGLFTDGQQVFIKDNMLGTINPVTTSAYVFTSESGTFSNRFEIVYADSALGTGDMDYIASNFKVYKSGRVLYLDAYNETIKNVNIFDITGKLLYSRVDVNSSQAEINNLNVQEQMLIVRTTLTNGVTIDKKVIY